VAGRIDRSQSREANVARLATSLAASGNIWMTLATPNGPYSGSEGEPIGVAEVRWPPVTSAVAVVQSSQFEVQCYFLAIA
jgi:hypothetical protein